MHNDMIFSQQKSSFNVNVVYQLIILNHATIQVAFAKLRSTGSSPTKYEIAFITKRTIQLHSVVNDTLAKYRCMMLMLVTFEDASHTF